MIILSNFRGVREKQSKLFFAKEWHHALASNLLRLHGDEEENILHSMTTDDYTGN